MRPEADAQRRGVATLGSTGSVGVNTLEGRIRLDQIHAVNAHTMETMDSLDADAIDAVARTRARQLVRSLSLSL